MIQAFGATTWITIAASLLLATAAFIVMRFYVRAVFREIRRSVSQPDGAAHVDDRALRPRTAAPLAIEILRPARRAGGFTPRSPTFQSADRAFRRAAYVYAFGGSIHAATSVGLLLFFGIYSMPATSSALAAAVWRASMFWAWSVFTLIALALFWGPDRRFRALLVLSYAAVLAGMGLLLELAATPRLPLLDVMPLESAPELMVAMSQAATRATRSTIAPEALTFSPHLQPILFWTLAGMPIMIPVISFNRFIRGTVGPLFISAALTITLTTFLLLELCLKSAPGVSVVTFLKGLFGPSTFGVLFGSSLLVSIVTVWLGLLWIAGRYRRRQLSDQTFLLDALWLAVSVCVAVLLMGSSVPFAFLLGLLPFAAYKLAVGFGLKPLRTAADTARDARLLYLRVFGSPQRTEKLFDLLAARWRYAGSVQVISGTDVARGRFAPDEFLDFLNGRLASAFINSESELEGRLAGLATRPDPDGRYRVNEVFCHVDTWQRTVARLMAMSDLLVMDLRAFTPKHEGCVFELGVILDEVSLSRVVLLMDATTNEPELRGTLAALWERVSPQSPNLRGPARATIVDLAGGYPAAVRYLMRLGDELMTAAR